MKRYLILILVAIFVLASGLELGCNGVTSEPTSSDYEQRIAELEEQVAALEEKLRESSVEHTSPPKVFEKTVQEVLGKASWPHDPEIKERQTIRFQLSTNNRVEGEVTISSIGGSNQVIATVRDPYGNIITQTATVQYNIPYLCFKSAQVYPWRFAFVPSSNGEYTLFVDTDWVSLSDPITAYLKVTIYKK